MKQPIRYFSIGLIVASLALFVVYEFFDTSQAEVDSVEIEALISTVQDHGYHVMEESEYIRLSVLQDNSEEDDDSNKDDEKKKKDTKDKEKDSKDKDKNEEKDNKEEEDQEKDDDTDNDKEDEEESTVKYSITIDPDMLPSDVSSSLEEENIIKDASKFNSFLEDNDYSQLIQIGTFDVSSDMSQEELANIITRSN